MTSFAALSLLGVFVSLPVVCEANFPTLKQVVSPQTNSIQVHPRRRLQDGSSQYSAIWYFVHEGSCSGATQPSIILSCNGGDGIKVDSTSSSVITPCTPLDSLSVECTTEATGSSGHAVDFTCAGTDLNETTATATIPTQENSCLGGDQLAAEWGEFCFFFILILKKKEFYCGSYSSDLHSIILQFLGHGLLLSLVCNDARVLNGTCTPLNTTFPDSTCTSGWSCPIGNCTEGDYTIGEMTSTISVNNCSLFANVPLGSPTKTPRSGSTILTNVVSATIVTIATVVALFGGSL